MMTMQATEHDGGQRNQVKSLTSCWPAAQNAGMWQMVTVWV